MTLQVQFFLLGLFDIDMELQVKSIKFMFDNYFLFFYLNIVDNRRFGEELDTLNA